VRPSERVCISGGVRSVERRHLDAPHGSGVSCGPFSQALGFSRNAVYAQLATRHLSRQDLIDVAERLGFNSNIPFDWPVPLGSLNVPYNDLAFARTATGFQGSTLSPLGAAYLASIIAQGGVAERLHLLAPPGLGRAFQDEAGTRVMKRATARRITRMMEVTVHSGTSRLVFNDESGKSLLPGVRVAGKTGTLRPDSGAETTSWFVGFAPADKPEIAVSVMLENGSVWRQRAAEVARDLLRVYFHKKGLRKIVDPLAPAEAPAEQTAPTKG
jgi:cell division protein FtsI/penicillin-binding protein 2